MKRRIWKRVLTMSLATGLISGSVVYGLNHTKVEAETVGQPVAMASVLTAQELKPRAELTKADTTLEPVVSEEQTVADVTANAMPSMVTISTMSVVEMMDFFGGTQKYQAEGAGTGIIIAQNDEELYIATNNHVISDAQQLSVGFIDETAAEAEIKATDPDTDLAVISVKLDDIDEDTMSQLKVATIGDSDALVLGEQIVVIGNALGYGQSVTSGYVSAFDRELDLSDGMNTFTSSDLIQVDAAINSGNSGGALLNMRGELVGINEAKSSMTSSGATVDNMGYAIPINKASEILEDLMNDAEREEYSDEDRGYLGVTCTNTDGMDKAYLEAYGMPEGVHVQSVTEDGPAEDAGIKKGDFIIAVDGKSVKSYERLTDRLRYYQPDDTVEITVLRADDGEYVEKTFSVTLGSRDVISGYTEPEEEIVEEEPAEPEEN